MTSKTIIAGLVALAFVAGSIMTTSMAYAAPNGQPFQELWDAIDNLQIQIDSISFVQDDPTEPALEIQVDPSSTEPALEVNDGTNVLFTINNDGSIQIGSNTVIVRPDGTVDGGPLFLQAGSTVDGQLISTGAHTTDTNASTLCTTGEYLDGDGTCKTLPNQVTGTCNQGSFVTGVNPDGSVICQALSFYQVSDTSTTTDNTIAICDPGDVAIAGGGLGTNDQALRRSLPIPTFAAWQAVTDGIGVKAIAVCLDNAPAHIP